jgi:hypothetical protein
VALKTKETLTAFLGRLTVRTIVFIFAIRTLQDAVTLPRRNQAFTAIARFIAHCKHQKA